MERSIACHYVGKLKGSCLVEKGQTWRLIGGFKWEVQKLACRRIWITLKGSEG